MKTITYNCFHCHEPGHLKANCPERVIRKARCATSIAKPPAGPRFEARPDTGEAERSTSPRYCLTCGANTGDGIEHHPTCGRPRSTPESIRDVLLAAGLDRSPMVRTPFRHAARIAPRSETSLRDLARQQLAEVADRPGAAEVAEREAVAAADIDAIRQAVGLAEQAAA